MSNIKISEIEWLVLGKRSNAKMCLSDFEKRKQIFAEFIYWLYNSFIIPILQSFFYITESSDLRNRTVYFRKDIWKLLCRPFITSMKMEAFEKINENNVRMDTQKTTLPPAVIRLLPKKNTFRLITNLRKRFLIKMGSNKKMLVSTNQTLRPVASILKHLINEESSGIPFNLEVYMKLLTFKKDLLKHRMFGRKKYFVRIDIKSCYDRIKQDLMFRIVKKKLKDPEFVIRKYATIHATSDRATKNFVSEAFSYFDMVPFEKVVQLLSMKTSDTLFVDFVDYWTKSSSEIFKMLKEHLSGHIVKIGNSQYLQKVGIPQGSILSSFLCHFYMEDLIDEYLSFTKKKGSVLLRVVDDFLFITVNKKDAKKFLNLSLRGFEKHNFSTSLEKTVINFENSNGIINNTFFNESKKRMPFFGFSVNMRSLDTLLACPKIDEALFNSTSVELTKHMGKSFFYKILRYTV